MNIRAASNDDLKVIAALLREAHLPSGDITSHIDHFLVAVENGVAIGTVGVEVYGSLGLLRSLAVEPAFQGRGIGKMLCESLMARAAGLGVEEIYLLTMNAAGFFERLGFNRVDRSGVPVEIQRTREFGEFCPASAVVMCRNIR